MTEKELRLIVRIGNVDLDGKKKLGIALTKIKGVSFALANALCKVAGVDKTKKTGECSDAEIQKLNGVIADPAKAKIPVWMLNRRKDYETGVDKHLFTGDLDFVKGNDIRRLRKIKAYRGVRHSLGLPVRGQSTKAHFRHGATLGVSRKKGK